MFFLKTAHILAAAVFFGTGLGVAFAKRAADRSGDLRVVAFAQRFIVLADLIFTIPAGLLLPATGLWLARAWGIPWTAPWILSAAALYVLTGLLWLPAMFLQLRMRGLAEQALAEGGELPPEFHRANRAWFLLGIPAFISAIAAIWIMVSKQSPLF